MRTLASARTATAPCQGVMKSGLVEGGKRSRVTLPTLLDSWMDRRIVDSADEAISLA